MGSNQGITRHKGEEQPEDQYRTQTGQETEPGKSITREATRDPKLNNPEKTPGSGMTPGDDGEAPTG